MLDVRKRYMAGGEGGRTDLELTVEPARHCERVGTQPLALLNCSRRGQVLGQAGHQSHAQDARTWAQRPQPLLQERSVVLVGEVRLAIALADAERGSSELTGVAA